MFNLLVNLDLLSNGLGYQFTVNLQYVLPELTDDELSELLLHKFLLLALLQMSSTQILPPKALGSGSSRDKDCCQIVTSHLSIPC